ncbi:phage integrase SAM-like domain-containing protein [Niabella hirudinis]|uniref:phage integrase SAM-like domain-containing protein n=1 Tax=Niabella hirudinis TaxID=1285929 RepID=UPI003EB75AED
MKIYFNLELDSYANRKGERAIMIRCTQHRQHKRIKTGIHINPVFWDSIKKNISKKHPLFKEYDSVLKQKLLNAEKIYLDIIRENAEITLQDFLEKLETPKTANFFDFAIQKKLNQFKSDKKMGTFRRYEAVLNKLKEFKGKNLPVSRVDYSLLKDFEAYLLNVKNNGRDTVSSNLSVIRSILNEAIKHGLYDKRNPFDSITLKYTDNTKQKLTIEELRTFSKVILPNIPSLHLARDFFMACFYMAGCRGGDMVEMKWSNVYTDKVEYIQRKSSKKMVLPVLPELRLIFERYQRDSIYIFPLLEREKAPTEFVINSKLTYINKYLKEVCKYAGIFKHISSHCARHTFSDISLSLNQNDIFSLKDVLGHSSVRTTEGYLRDRNYSGMEEYLKNISELI